MSCGEETRSPYDLVGNFKHFSFYSERDAKSYLRILKRGLM